MARAQRADDPGAFLLRLSLLTNRPFRHLSPCTSGETNTQKSSITMYQRFPCFWSGLPIFEVFKSWLTLHTFRLMQLPHLFTSRMCGIFYVVHLSLYFWLHLLSFVFCSSSSVLNFCFNMNKQQKNKNELLFIVFKIPNGTCVTEKLFTQMRSSYSSLGTSPSKFRGRLFLSFKGSKEERNGSISQRSRGRPHRRSACL